ncbi:class I SAM-dependent methyltransferase [Candidatus Nomurabacteria bacterium]|nr:class I SAM-dependent methyltransferase [Candidatus Nomurabacteria bacterium]
MKYKSDFAQFQSEYTTKYPNSLHMRTYLPPLKGKSVLDVGCGSGIDLAFFASQKPKKLAGCDISPELVMIAKQKVPSAEIRNDSFSYISQKNEVFDIVWSKYALNCTLDIMTPLKEIYRVLKNNGTAYIQVTHPFRTLSFLKSKDYFSEKLLVEYPVNNGEKLVEPHHTISSWINAITEAGFQIIKCEEILNRPKEEYTEVITPSAIIFILKK